MRDRTLQRQKEESLEVLITNEYNLCDYCLGRLLSKQYNSISYSYLGKKLRKRLSLRAPKKCFICKNMFDNLGSYVELLLSKLSNYQFNTFVLGVILKPSISERDDLIKSKFKIKAVDSVKTGITRELSKRFSRKTKTRLDNFDPDLTLIMDSKNESCELRSKPIYLYCRYTKHERGLSQKQKSCENCNGKGCSICKKHGIVEFNSVEGRISKFLYEKFCCEKIKINWIGGEDKSSLVLGKGRPIFIKIINPIKRKIILPKKIILDEIILYNSKVINEQPKGSKPFRSYVLLNIVAKKHLDSDLLRKIKNVKNKPVLITEKSKTNKKFIYRIKYKKIGLDSFTVLMSVDGGFPIKRFVEGKNVSPNISDIIKNKCKCKQFDFKQIDLLN